MLEKLIFNNFFLLFNVEHSILKNLNNLMMFDKIVFKSFLGGFGEGIFFGRMSDL
jgi:hypothetical protein